MKRVSFCNRHLIASQIAMARKALADRLETLKNRLKDKPPSETSETRLVMFESK